MIQNKTRRILKKCDKTDNLMYKTVTIMYKTVTLMCKTVTIMYKTVTVMYKIVTLTYKSHPNGQNTLMYKTVTLMHKTVIIMYKSHPNVQNSNLNITDIIMYYTGNNYRNHINLLQYPAPVISTANFQFRYLCCRHNTVYIFMGMYENPNKFNGSPIQYNIHVNRDRKLSGHSAAEDSWRCTVE
jgi:hypothetical protein